MFNPYKIVEKPWGSERWLQLTDKYCCKIIEIKQGFKTSLQYHKYKEETNYLFSGKALYWRQDLDKNLYSTELNPGDVVNLKPGEVHRFEALTNIIFFETSTPEVWDVERISDEYGR